MRQGVTAVVAGSLLIAGVTSVMVVLGDGTVVVIRGRAIDRSEQGCRQGQMTQDEQHADTAPGAAWANG
jgi:hypothetical protein